jgi:hypothetical protein
MDSDEATCGDQTRIVNRSDGITSAERYLRRLCDHSFLSMWSYPGIYRDQGRGKEVCDLLVVFENHIIIFSDKDCQFPNTGNLQLDWNRWFRQAVVKSANQVWGAERWIRSHPDRLFLDRACTKPFPIDLPDPAQATFHRIVVAHESAERCQKELGGSGSLMIMPGVIGEMHYMGLDDGGGPPFAVGQIDTAKGYVHVLDDASLAIVMDTLDTVSDFVAYLSKKEQFVLSGRLASAAGEEELLAVYLAQLNEDEKHDFVVPSDVDAIALAEGFWESFSRSPQRSAQLAANDISYFWDALIEKFSHYALTDTQYFATHPGLRDQERLFRFLAHESRIRRRMLAAALLNLIAKTPESKRGTRVMFPSHERDPVYVFLLVPHLWGTYEQYRDVRRKFLEACCRVIKLKFSWAQDIVGIATETGPNEQRSEDAMYFDARTWTEEDRIEAESLQRNLDLLTQPSWFGGTEYEYPEVLDHLDQDRVPLTKRPARNKPCLCGSGKKYKHCCGKPSTAGTKAITPR